jgi:hypothetical protein
MHVRFAMILLTVIATLTSQSASARMGQCSGILHQENHSIGFGGRTGETEGICIVGKSDRKKVLATCSLGNFCRLRGIVQNCRESGECTEISRISSVSRH